MIFDTEAYAEGICNSAAGSSIETFVDTLDALVQDVLADAMKYRRSIADDEKALGYEDILSDLTELHAAIVARERRNGETTHFFN